jgi:triose/dihydroxyacetone kinase / FAD-AMP lyase (cyclizing)
MRCPGYKVMIRADSEKVRELQVAVISGGSSGHEPAHAGYIGAGMLSASVLGAVFTSLDTDSIVAAIKAVAGKRGVLLVVKNYTGDRLNFGLAAEIARSERIPVEMIVVHDDVALNGSGSITGPRGLAGTVFIHKIVGAAAAEGMRLAEVAAIGRAAVDSLATIRESHCRPAPHLLLANQASNSATMKWSLASASKRRHGPGAVDRSSRSG